MIGKEFYNPSDEQICIIFNDLYDLMLENPRISQLCGIIDDMAAGHDMPMPKPGEIEERQKTMKRHVVHAAAALINHLNGENLWMFEDAKEPTIYPDYKAVETQNAENFKRDGIIDAVRTLLHDEHGIKDINSTVDKQIADIERRRKAE